MNWVSFFVSLCYNIPCYVSGKQVKLLYEPVAVRHVRRFFYEGATIFGQAIGRKPEKAEK